MWLVLATDGAIIAPILRLCGVDKLSMGFTLILCVMVEGKNSIYQFLEGKKKREKET